MSASLIDVGRRNSIQFGKIPQILHPAHLVIKKRRMRHVADLRAESLDVGGAENGKLPPRRMREAGNGSQQCGLPCAVIAEDDVKLPCRKFSGYASQGRK